MIAKKEYNGWKVQTGDDEFDAEMGGQLTMTEDEVCKAINKLGLVDKIYRHILDDRSKIHKALKERIPK